ncbi:RloB family protein [uncultured Clostridium sp.]|uniref:RloB family protein n=1 Tax=uncultured Clostridium sp. TaxID=59620 RepID=UPI0026F461DF|nr:RloB family protein [uncultured Clostridium sp.]
MRVQTSSKFAERPNEIMMEMPKYFLIYEGEVTEPMYFSGIIVNRKRLAINQSLSLISVLRSLEDLSKSHPKYALKIANDIKSQSTENVISKENLFKSIVDFIKNEDRLDKEELINLADHYIKNYANDLIDLYEIDNIIIDIYKDDTFKNITSDIINYLEFQRITLDYNPKIDVINLIVDRDKGNFKSHQYDNLVKKCKENNISLYISNPCFEAWLLMHFEEFDNLDFDKLLENKRVNSKRKSRKYSDKMLSEIIGYNKSNLNFDIFVDRIDEAIKREKKYCEDIEELKNKIGSNVGILIENMRN